MDTGQDGVYCSTAGAVFQEREALQEHYHSELHRYVYYLWFASLYFFTFISLISYWMSVEACLLLLSLCLKETNPMSDISVHVSVDII